MNSKRFVFWAAAIPVFLPEIVLAQSDAPAALVNDWRVILRQGPGRSYDRLTLVDKGRRVTVLTNQGVWTQVRLSDGRTGWLHRQFLDTQKSQAATEQPAVPSVASAPPKQAAPRKANRTAAVSSSSPTPQAGQSSAAATDLAGTRPDPVDRTQDSPAAAMGDAWKFLLYLLPILGVIVLVTRGLRAFYQRTGGLPSLRQGLLGGLNLANARRVGGSNLRVVESVPIGTAGLHLVEARGRLLLLGTSGSGITLLTELNEEREMPEAAFHSLLRAAAEDMEDGLDEANAPLSSVIGSLDDTLRDVREAIARNAARVRQWDDGNDARNTH